MDVKLTLCLLLIFTSLSLSLQGLLGIVELTVIQSVKQDTALVRSLLVLYVVDGVFSLCISRGR